MGPDLPPLDPEGAASGSKRKREKRGPGRKGGYTRNGESCVLSILNPNVGNKASRKEPVR